MSKVTKSVICMPFDMAMHSELSRQQFYSVAQSLLTENEELRNAAAELRKWATCDHFHHDKRDYHERDEPCKALARIDATLGKER